MNASSQHPASQAVDLSKYANDILATQDHPLFDDAVEAAKVGALRAAYVMIWLACAESLKRRFREAQVRDNAASKIVGEIENMERQHKAVDKFLLDKAHKYGFVSDSGRTVLSQIYEMRCIYGHPYEEAPSHEKVTDAAAALVELILSKPIKLRHGFGKQLLESLLTDRNYLDDHEPAVAASAKNILPRLDESIHAWLLDEYWKALDKLWDDSSMAVFSRRGMWFCRAVLTEACNTIFTHDDWHDRSGRFPKTLINVCSIVGVFKDIGERAQDSLVGAVLDESKTRPSALTHLEGLNNGGALSERQQKRFSEGVSELILGTVPASGLSTKTCYTKLIDELKSHNWYIQNPAIEMVVSNGPDQATELTEEQQVNLGRNILQAADGAAASAIDFLETLSSGATDWPYGVVRGIALESFTNEKNEIRLKDRRLNLVLSVLERRDCVQRNELIAQIAASVDVGTPKYRLYPDEYDQIVCSLNAHAWAAPLVSVLETKLLAGLREEA